MKNYKEVISIHRYRLILMLVAFILNVSSAAFAQYNQYNITRTSESSCENAFYSSFSSNMIMTWDINTGLNQKIIISFWAGLSQYSTDYVNIYEIDKYGHQNQIACLTGSATGEITTNISSGRARIEFITNFYTNPYYGDYSAFGFQFCYNIAPSTYLVPNLDVTGNIYVNSDMEIGTVIPSGNRELRVKGGVKAREVIMTDIDWADFVFDKSYELPDLKSVEQHILTRGHLQGIPSAVEVKEKGVNLGEMQAKLLQKVEELTLYVIQHDKDIDKLKKARRN